MSAPTPLPEIKVCGLTRVEDIRAAHAAGVAYFGINRHCASPRFVASEKLPPLLAAIPPGRRVFVAVAPDLETLAEAMAAGFDFFQIHFDPAATGFIEIAGWSGTVGVERLWLAPRLKPGAPFPEGLIRFASGWLVDGYSPNAFGGTGKTADFDSVARLKTAHPDKRWLLAGGLSPDNIADAARRSRADILDLNSGVEDAPGLKNAEKIARSFARIRN